MTGLADFEVDTGFPSPLRKSALKVNTLVNIVHQTYNYCPSEFSADIT